MIDTKKNMIAIDGPAGSGKSTIAKHLAKKLNWTHVNTGAIYRTFGFLLDRMFQDNIPDVENLKEETVHHIAKIMNEEYRQDDQTQQIFLDQENITSAIHLPRVSYLASVYAQKPYIREQLLPLQRKIVESYKGVIVDGRDMGTVVFPDAPLKIFLTANAHTRAKRRFAELQSNGLDVNFETLLKELEERDLRDSTRDTAPAKPATDAIIVDSSNHSIDEVVEIILRLYHKQDT